MFFNVPSAKDVANVLFKISYGKTVVFIISFLLFLAFISFKGIKDENNIRTRHPFIGIFFTVFAMFLIVLNYTVPQEPYVPYESSIILGNTSKSLSQNNVDRLEYLGDNLVLVKRSAQDTPSLWDIDNKDVEDNRDHWKTEAIEPIWDTSIQVYGDWTIIHCELYYPRNGIDPVGAKHEHDYEFIEFYYYKNETEPRYVVFPTYVKITEHPRVLLHWEDMPELGGRYGLRLDPQTNAFHEDYDKFPDPSKNFRPTLVSPEASETFEYLSEVERLQFQGAMFAFVGIFIYCFVKAGFKNKYLFLMFICIVIALYPIFTLQYDYIANPSFRVWENGEHYDDSYWYESQSGRDYISDYGGLPHDRERWTKPAYSEEIGIVIPEEDPSA